MDHEPGPVRGDRTVAFRREVALVETVLTALAPVVVTLLLGFVAAWHHDFAAKDAAVLNRMVLLYAVPVARKRPSHRRRTRRSATRVFRKSFGKRSKNRSYGHRYSLSRPFWGRQNPSDSRPWTFAFKPCVG